MLKMLGLFKLSKWMTRNSLKIICYHGVAIEDEAEWSPTMYIKKETINKRFRYLKENNYEVISLNQAIKNKQANQEKNHAIVLTYDDGQSNFYSQCFPLLKEYSYPATVYVNTLFIENEALIFRHAFKYFFWKSTALSFDFSDKDFPIKKLHKNARNFSSDIEKIFIFVEKKYSFLEQKELLIELYTKYHLSLDFLINKKAFFTVTEDELRELEKSAISVDLHTHTHSMLISAFECEKEIVKNKAALKRILNKNEFHFCYPSGIWSKDLWPVLEKENILSATTCEGQFNFKDRHLYELNRIMDSENLSDIEFEAEVSGMAPFLRDPFFRLKF